tara:strand:- start:583 stop:1071 length:489 start_codon:yes stop_codon:yes gene_type:complete
MITNCVLMYAALMSNFSVGITPEISDLEQITYCQNNLPANTLQYSTLLVNNFKEKNIETAVKVMFCESRMKAKAYRWQADDSGLFQVIPRTWGWVKSKYNIPYWDYPIGNSYAQFIPKYNIEVAALLVEEMHTRDNYWKPWNSSKWCWEDNNKFENIWRSEQ